MNMTDPHTADFERLVAAGPAWLSDARHAALLRFRERGLPTPRDEEWKYTDVAALAKADFRLADEIDIEAARRLLPTAAVFDGVQLVFVHGAYVAELSRSVPQTGLDILPLSQTDATTAERWQARIGQAAAREGDPFGSLNAAMLRDGALIRIARGSEIPDPIHLIFLTPGASRPLASHPYVAVIAEEQTSATILESYVGEDSAPYLTNASTDLTLEAGARLRHYRVQREGSQAFHIGTVRARQNRDSRFSSIAVSLGAKLSRTNIETVLDGPGSECDVDGLYLGEGSQHHDHRTSIDHQHPRTTSRELYKGILDDRATGVFNGKVFVRPHALKSDARQMNHNLLLSDNAEVDTKPQLEIFADDVRCSHGATIGRLEETALFYLQSRGIDRSMARNVLIYAFANELVGRIAVPIVRSRLAGILEARFGLPGAGTEGI